MNRNLKLRKSGSHLGALGKFLASMFFGEEKKGPEIAPNRRDRRRARRIMLRRDRRNEVNVAALFSQSHQAWAVYCAALRKMREKRFSMNSAKKAWNAVGDNANKLMQSLSLKPAKVVQGEVILPVGG